MNAKTDIEPVEEVRPDPPGRRLRQAREAKGLSQQDIAEQLRLRVAVIDAMERDDFDHLPAATFLRGYLRNYANQLALPGDELVDAYNRYMGEQSQQPMRHFRLERPRSGIPMAVAGLGLVVLLLVAILWWVNNSQPVSDHQQADGSGEASELQAQQVPDGQEPEQATPSLAEPGLPDEMQNQLSEELPESVEPYDPPMEDAVQDGIVPAEEMRSSAENVETVEVAASEGVQESALDDVQGNVQKELQATTAADEAAALLSAEPQLSVDGLALYLQGDSWVDVRDGTGKRLLYRMGRSGKEYRAEGTPPYQVKLGNAAAVKVYYNGAPFDTAAYTEGNVARFSVGKASSE